MARPRHADSSENFAQHLTWTTLQRVPTFKDPKVAEMCLIAMDKERERLGVEVFGFVLMPDHMHLVVGPSTDAPGKIVQGMKMCSNWWLQAFGLVEKSPWARGYWDRAIRSTEELRTALRYVHGNPVKAGLADSLGDYSFSSYGHYYEGVPPLIRVSRFT